MIHRILFVAAAVVAALLLGGGNALACDDGIHVGGVGNGNQINPTVTTGDIDSDVADVSTCGGVAQLGIGSADEQTCT
ncbi:MAG: hypothetical protein GEU83_11950 [Pseudonocardiaceae bacterium]|nr:hypothetical protein [Pseudonocardiaceae bacterium]